MSAEATERACREANWTRYQPGQSAGHYESFFLRANHPTRPLAFWIRYTIFSPQARPADAIGELWAVYFDGETNQHVAAKREVPFAQCAFGRSEFSVDIATAHLEAGRLQGTAGPVEPEGGAHTIDWDLSFDGAAPPLFFLPLALYRTRLPSAKSLVSAPLAVYHGMLSIDGKTIDVSNWVGSQNHNWGRKHTDFYAWGQVAGFDTHADSFLEVATARLKLGPLWTPFMTLLVLRHRGEQFALNRLRQSLRAHGSVQYFTWQFRSETDRVCIDGTISAPRQAFVGLRYYNPPGGIKHCLNSKLAACELRLTDKRAGTTTEVLSTTHRAAFEILTDERNHGVEIRV